MDQYLLIPFLAIFTILMLMLMLMIVNVNITSYLSYMGMDQYLFFIPFLVG